MKKARLCLLLVALACGKTEKVVKTISVTDFNPNTTNSTHVLFLISEESKGPIVFPKRCLVPENCGKQGGPACKRTKVCGYDKLDGNSFTLSGDVEGTENDVNLNGKIEVYACFIDKDGVFTGSGKALIDGAAGSVSVKPADQDTQCASVLASIPVE